MDSNDTDWKNAIKDVKPIKKEKTYAKHSKTKLTETDVDDWEDFEKNKPTKETFENIQELTEEYQQSQPQQKQQIFRIHSNISSKISASIASLDSKAMKKLSQGKIPPENKIDLHGFYLDDAWGALMDFINKSAKNGLRCVLVVHGKGKGYGEKKDMGIIKSQVNQWLCGHPKILAYHTAIINHGGNGALYVLLKRQN